MDGDRMARWFDRLVMLVIRFRTLDLTTKFFWSLMYYGLTPADRTAVVENLMDYVADSTVNSPEETY